VSRPYHNLQEEPIPGSFYDADYYTAGTKSSYGPYGPGHWAVDLTVMVVEYLAPDSVLDVGCAYGYIVERLRRVKIDAWGFDVSAYAISQSVIPSSTWVGAAEDPNAYGDTQVDLALATEMCEHLVPAQARAFLRNAYAHADRMLLLIALDLGGDGDPTEGDHSHINFRPLEWWLAELLDAGWNIGDASRFNDDQRAIQMNWNGRFIYATKET